MSDLFDPLSAAGPVRATVDDQAWLQAMLDFERALAQAQSEAGLLSPEHAKAIAVACDPARYNPTEIGATASGIGNPAAPLVRALTAEVGGEAARYVHLGATSQDVLDTASMLVLRRAVAELLSIVDRAGARAAELAARYRDTPQAGRTLGQQALPVTFGLTAAGWVSALTAARERLRGLRFAVQLGGAAGTLASLEEVARVGLAGASAAPGPTASAGSPVPAGRTTGGDLPSPVGLAVMPGLTPTADPASGPAVHDGGATTGLPTNAGLAMPAEAGTVATSAAITAPAMAAEAGTVATSAAIAGPAMAAGPGTVVTSAAITGPVMAAGPAESSGSAAIPGLAAIPGPVAFPGPAETAGLSAIPGSAVAIDPPPLTTPLLPADSPPPATASLPADSLLTTTPSLPADSPLTTTPLLPADSPLTTTPPPPTGPAVLTGLARALNLEEPTLPWHTERSRITTIAAALADLAATAAGIARTITLLAQTEIGEVHEQGPPGSGGSSTLPHKQNPVAAVLAAGAAAQAPGLVGTLFSVRAQEYQRAAGHWHAEWRPLAELVRVTGAAAYWMAESLERLRVDPVRMRANLDRTGGVLLAERVTAALTGRVGRLVAHDVVGRCARRAVAGEDFAAVLGADPVVAAQLSRQRIVELLDPAGYLGSAGVFVDRALAAWHMEDR
ncbi:lyase family protein [Crossiella cryophila]|uniref:Adenylosuccinate lyase n=1 Tax=Crossiella cryophila TaxID=43355 RepID=A0A7W7CDE7_9PSEU|nr:lyase family protein [Crossiella cryophila]MBB4678992.1 adenylosuccinate lyase [Crossiella cryophila]